MAASRRIDAVRELRRHRLHYDGLQPGQRVPLHHSSPEVRRVRLGTAAPRRYRLAFPTRDDPSPNHSRQRSLTPKQVVEAPHLVVKGKDRIVWTGAGNALKRLPTYLLDSEPRAMLKAGDPG